MINLRWHKLTLIIGWRAGCGDTAAVPWDTDRADAACAVNPAGVTASGSENAGATPGPAFDGDGSSPSPAWRPRSSA
ncbi:hypothetical protein [Streptomyces roseochromogenus]|uniref:hypothetical protein n=1 Tax=Streptomyces roseochromogenus TaxID=285450 RepID=UPI000996FBE7